MKCGVKNVDIRQNVAENEKARQNGTQGHPIDRVSASGDRQTGTVASPA